MKVLKQIGIALVISILVVSGANFLNTSDMGVGAITTILGTDKLSDSRVTINDNFTDLDTTKMEISTTTLPFLTTLTGLVTVGTIGTGVWQGTDITVANGGTGLSTLTVNAVMLGNGTSNIAFVSGLGTSGQFLTSQGAGSDPQWTTSAIDEAGNFTWTGTHLFATTTSIGSSASGGLVPAGSIIAYASTTAPAGWLLADGTSYPTATFPDLFTAIGYGFGGSGANFNIPDLQNRQITMASSTPNIGQTGGEQNHTMTEDELVAHTHPVSIANSGSIGASRSQGSDAGESFTSAVSTGGGQAFNVLDPYIVLNYIIKY